MEQFGDLSARFLGLTLIGVDLGKDRQAERLEHLQPDLAGELHRLVAQLRGRFPGARRHLHLGAEEQAPDNVWIGAPCGLDGQRAPQGARLVVAVGSAEQECERDAGGRQAHRQTDVPGQPGRGRVVVTIEGLLELERTVEEVTPDTPRARERVLRHRCKGDREGRRVRPLLGERKRCFGIRAPGLVVTSDMRHPRELAEDVHLLAGLEAGLREGEAQEAHGHRKALCHPAYAGELAEGLGSDSTGLRGADYLLEQDRRLLQVARIPAVLGGGDAASVDALDRVYRGERDRALGELCRRLRGAARTRVGRGRIERRCDLFVGTGGGDREMAGALLEIDIEFGEAAVEPTPSVQRHRRIAGGGE